MPELGNTTTPLTMRSSIRYLLLCLMVVAGGSARAGAESVTESAAVRDAAAENSTETPPPASNAERRRYKTLNLDIVEGTASFVDVRRALSETDVGRLTNTMHAMHGMRWQRVSMKLLLGIWQEEESVRKDYPELAWEALATTPVRLALASTLLRFKPPDAEPYLKYLLQHKHDEHEFHRAQVVIALGLHGDPDDIEYLAEMADSDNDYVVRTALTGLGLMQNTKAKQQLGLLWKKYRGGHRGELIEQVLLNVYRVTPHVREKGDSPNLENEAGPS